MGYYIGIDLGGTNISVGVVDDNYKIVGVSKGKTNSKRPLEEIVDDMAHIAIDAIKNANLTLEDIVWVGIGAPGTVNQDLGRIDYSNNLDWYDVPIKDMLQERMQKDVYVANDANAAAYGEYIAGSAKEANISVMVTLGTGVGGGIVIDNKVYTGFNFAGAELGHSVIEIDGRPCTCGRKGCLEAYASATGLIKTTKDIMEQDKDSIMWELCESNLDKVNGRLAFNGAKQGDKSSQNAIDRYIKELACGLINIINIFQPDILCIGGGLSNEGENLLNPLKKIIAGEVYSRNSAKNTEVVLATLGNDAGIIGAAMLGKQ